MITVEDVRAFMDAINKGREALGLEAISTLEFSQSTPNSAVNCLSARHLIRPSGEYGTYVGKYTFTVDQANREALAQALGTEIGQRYDERGVVIPDAILKVTDEFDALSPDCETDLDMEDPATQAFHAVLFEAGVVDA